MTDHCFQRRIGAVMAIRCGLGDIAQAGRAELICICRVSGDPEATFVAGVCLEAGTLAGADLRQGNGMKVVIGLKLPGVAGAALRFAIKQGHTRMCCLWQGFSSSEILIKWAIIGAPLKGDKLCNDVRDIGERHAMPWPVDLLKSALIFFYISNPCRYKRPSTIFTR